MTKPELQALLEAIAESLDLITKYFPRKLADDLLEILANMPPGESIPALQRIVTNARDVFCSAQSAELSAFLRDLEERPFLLKILLRRINRA